LLIEAGKDTPPGHEPSDVTDIYPLSYYNKRNMWPGFTVHWRTRTTSVSVPMSQARIMGGGSSVMGMMAFRGTPDDFAEWEQLGADGWGWDDVLPYYRKLETDFDFANEFHGQNGPTPIRRVKKEEWPPLTKAIDEFARARGFPFVEDMNGDFRDGYGATAISNTTTSRASSAICYLGSDVRARRNLTIQCLTTVKALVADGKRIVGVKAAEHNGKEIEFYARETVLCSGALFSPAMMLRAGIGPADELSQLGIPVVADVPGVGRNLQNHPTLYVAARLRRSARQSDTLRAHPTTSLRYSSGSDCPSDMFINIQSKSSWNATGRQIANLSGVLWKPFSRGQITLVASRDYPLVEFNFLSDDRDLQRLMSLFAMIVEIMTSPQVLPLFAGPPFPVRYMDRIRRLNELTPGNARQARLIATMLDLMPEGLSYRLLMALAGGRVDLEAVVADRASLADLIVRNLAGVFHPAGTCRMGSRSDPNAVVDVAGRVQGLSGLRVADASVMPTVTRGNTNIPTLMVAEKIADAIKSTASQQS
jgi:5-(hydroxymethyl)furfural/furfural oxidase